MDDQERDYWTQQIRQLEQSNRRWKLVSLTLTATLVIVLILGGMSTFLFVGLELPRQREMQMQAERARAEAERARAEAERKELTALRSGQQGKPAGDTPAAGAHDRAKPDKGEAGSRD